MAKDIVGATHVRITEESIQQVVDVLAKCRDASYAIVEAAIRAGKLLTSTGFGDQESCISMITSRSDSMVAGVPEVSSVKDFLDMFHDVEVLRCRAVVLFDGGSWESFAVDHVIGGECSPDSFGPVVVALNHKGETVDVGLNDIYREAQEAFGDDCEVTTSEYWYG